MESDLIVRYFHFLSIFVMFSLLNMEHVLLKGRVDLAAIRRLSIIDAAYGISAITALGCGLGLWLWVGKPAGFYTNNWVFHTKLTLFVVTALLSIPPTLFLLKARRSESPTVEVPKAITILVRVELLMLCAIPLLAVLMANGVGYTK